MESRVNERVVKAFALYQEGLSCTQIGAKWGVSRQVVNKLLHSHPLYKARDRSQATRLGMGAIGYPFFS